MNQPTQPVFISYARDASREYAEKLHEALGGRTAFLDTEDIAPGERFPEALVNALFAAKVVVIFAEPSYFKRWYCLLEFRIARTPFLRALERPGATVDEKKDALRGLVVAMPPRGVDPMMERFPNLVSGRNWPDVGDIEKIAELVESELAADPPTLRERYASVAEAEAARSFLLEATRLPPPLKIGNISFVPQTGLPPSIRDAFVGRADDLWRIHDLLWTERGDPATAAGLTGAIEAIGGFGKTRLALEYLYRFGPRHFRGGLFWINAESDPELQLYDVLQALNSQTPDIAEVRQRPGGVPGAVARAIRSRTEDAPMPLFIIDNVPEPEAGQRPKSLETWCPVLGEVPVLTTSRTRVAIGAGGSVVALPIETLDPESAVALLATEVRRDSLEDLEWKEIAEWVGHLPLALEVLNRLLRSGEMTARALLDLSREQTPSVAVDRAMESIRHAVPEGALRGVTEAFSASYDRLDPGEQYATRLIAWMAPAPIPVFVIDAFGVDVFTPGIRGKLRNRSFVTEVRDASGDFFGTMHRVLADFVRAQSNNWESEVKVVSSLLTELMKSVRDRGAEGSRVAQGCAPLVASVFVHWIAKPVNDISFFEARVFLNDVGVMLAQWGLPEAAGDLFTSLVSATSKRLGSEELNTLAAMDNLANTLIDRGDSAGAQALQERVLSATRRALGDEHSDTLISMNNLANTLRERGDYAGAQDLYVRVVETRLRTSGEEHPDTLATMHNLALLKKDLGDDAGAEALQEQVLEAMRRVLGNEHPATLITMSNLANTQRYRGNFAGAEALHDYVVQVRRRTLGDEHPYTLTSMHNLAVVRRDRGDLGGAQELQERVLSVMQRQLGLEHPSTTVTAWGLVRTYIAQGSADSANRVIRECLAWLLDCDSALLTEQQRKIRGMILSIIESRTSADLGR